MYCLTKAWSAHEAELHHWARRRLRVARETVELPEDLSAPVDDTDTVDSLTACLPWVLSELSDEDRDAITQCDLQGMAQAAFAQARGLSLKRGQVTPAVCPAAPEDAHDAGLPGATGCHGPCGGFCAAPINSVGLGRTRVFPQWQRRNIY